MMAPMMYGMFGTMIGGMLGGWLAGLLDEHEGHPDHDNPVMVSAMALMAGMMGGMPSGMIGGMLAIMGTNAIAITIAAGLALVAVTWAAVMRGRYRVAAAGPFVGAADEPATPAIVASVAEEGSAVLHVKGMTCDACRVKVTRKVGALPGVHAVDVDVEAGRVEVRWGDGFVGLDAVRERIDHLGYSVE
jgi:copper chaperone